MTPCSPSRRRKARSNRPRTTPQRKQHYQSLQDESLDLPMVVAAGGIPPEATGKGDNMGSIGSIGSTLNSINQSLLAEISSYLSTSKTASGAGTTASSSASASDQVDFSQVAKLFQELKQLQSSNPAEFKQVMTDAAKQLTAAAQQTTDPSQANFLSSLANKFQQASATGSMAPFEQSSSASGASGAHHHHHHGGHPAERLEQQPIHPGQHQSAGSIGGLFRHRPDGTD